MNEPICRRTINGKNMSESDRRAYNIKQREKFPHNPGPYLPVKCSYEGCPFHFVPIDNAYETLCPVHKTRNPKINECPYMNHEMIDTSFFVNGYDKDLPTDFNHANYTPVR